MTQELKHTTHLYAGLGLRTQHITDILQGDVTDNTWFELLADNWLSTGGVTAYYLDAISERFPITLHGVGLSLGGPQAIDLSYLNRIKDLQRRSQALWYSEHLCFSHTSATHVAHDLLPLPYTDEAIKYIVPRIQHVQDVLEQPVLIENVSSYIQYKSSAMTEAEFLSAIAHEAGCKILLDLNNIYVSSYNQDAEQADTLALIYLEHMQTCNIGEIHLAGFEHKANHLIDAHNHPVSEPVWQLYNQALKQFGLIPTIIEWDNALPCYQKLSEQRALAQTYIDRYKQQNVLAAR